MTKIKVGDVVMVTPLEDLATGKNYGIWGEVWEVEPDDTWPYRVAFSYWGENYELDDIFYEDELTPLGVSVL